MQKISRIVFIGIWILLIVVANKIAQAETANLNATVTDSDEDDTPATVNYEISTNDQFSSTETSGSESVTLSNSSGSFSKSVDLSPSALTKYYWRAKAKDKHEAESGWLSAQSFTIDPCISDKTGPNQITSLAATSGDKEVYLSWKNPSGASSIKIYRSTSASFTISSDTLIKTISNATTKTYTDSGLTNNITYYYIVVAADSCGNLSQDSATISATPRATLTLVATCQDSANSLEWNIPKDTASYKLYRSSVPNVSTNAINLIKTISDANTKSYQDIGLTNGTNYYYKLETLDLSGNIIVTSNEIKIAPCSATPPHQVDLPSNIFLEYKDIPQGIDITWKDPEDSDLSYIEIYRLNEETGEYILIAQVLPGVEYYFDMDIIEGSTYYYKFHSVDILGQESEFSQPYSIIAVCATGCVAKTSETVSNLIDNLMGNLQENPILIAAAQSFAPFSVAMPIFTIIGISVAQVTMGSLIDGSNIYNIIRYIFLGGWKRRRKKPWGICLSLNTQMPIAGSLVQLMSAKGKKIVDKSITDKFGRFIFLVKKTGDYQIVVSARGFDRFVSQEFNVENISETPQDMIIHLKDNKDLVEFVIGRTVSALMLLINILKHLRLPIIIFGTFLAIYQVLIINDRITWLILLFYIVIWIMEVVTRIMPRTYGVVWDDTTDKPLDRAIVRFFKIINNQLALTATTVTASDGAFRFLFAAGQYQCGAVRIGYKSYMSEKLTFGNKSLPNLNIRLEPMKSEKQETFQSEKAGEKPIDKTPSKPPTQGPKVFEDINPK